MDCCTMVYNMNLVRNSNARGNVIDCFNDCKEYVNFETNAYILTLAIKYFGLTDFEASEDQVIPPNILKADPTTKRHWLHHK